MSFSVDLWNGFDLLKEKLTFTYNKAQILYNIFITFINMEKEYSKNLDILYKDYNDKIKEEFLLEKSFIQLIQNFKEQSKFHKNHIDFISKYLINPLKEILDQQKSLFQLFTDNTKNLEILEKSKNNLISKEEKYHNICADLTNYLISNDSNFINNNSSFSNDKSLLHKRQKLINKINENKKEYISALYESNVDLDQYNIKATEIMNELENRYDTIIDLLKWSLINYANNKISICNKINNLYKTILQEYFTNIDVNEEIMNFIIKNATKEFPSYKFEFIPYKLNTININLFKENERKNNVNQCNKKINLIKKFFSENKLIDNIFPKEINKDNNNISVVSCSIKKLINFEKKAIKIPKLEKCKKRNISEDLNYAAINNINNKFVLKDRESQMNSNLTYIEFFIDKLMLKKNETKKQEIEKFKNIFLLNKFENSIYFDSFMKTLNEYRAKGKFAICRQTYDILVEVFIFMFENFQEQDNLLKILIILSQTFYFLRENNKKGYIQRAIKNHKVFNNSKLWHRVINYTLGESIINKDIAKKIDKKEVNNKLKIIALNTLIAYLCDLKCFTDNQKVFNDVKKFYCTIYDLNEQEVDKNVEISQEGMNISRTVTEYF